MSLGVFQSKAMALGESAIRVKYNGAYDFACVIVDQDGGTGSSPLIKLGVSDTDLAAAVTAAETVYTSTGDTNLMNDMVNAIRWWKTTTSGAVVESKDFDCEITNALGNSTIDTPYHATVEKFVDDDGSTTNFADGDWHGTVLWVNVADSVGTVSLRLPPAGTSKGQVTIASKTGEATVAAETVLTQGITARIYNDDGDVLWTSGKAMALAGVNLDWNERPVTFNSPVIIRDTATDASTDDVAATDAVVVWDVARI